MIVTAELAEYLTRVVNALDTNTLHPDARRTRECPECDEPVSGFGDDNHLIWVRDRHGRNSEVVLIVACEEYWVIDPNLVGIDKPTWMHPEDHVSDDVIDRLRYEFGPDDV